MNIIESFPITWVEVFISEYPLGGSLLPVIHDVDDKLSTDIMLKISKRFSQAETSFLQKSTIDKPVLSIQSDLSIKPSSIPNYRHRIFTIEEELPFAGHPSLGSAAALAWKQQVTYATYTQETISGLQNLTVNLNIENKIAKVSLFQNKALFQQPFDTKAILRSLGINSESTHPSLPSQIVSTGLPCIIIPISNMEALSNAVFNRYALKIALLAIPGIENIISLNCYLVAKESIDNNGISTWRARSFALDNKTGEDSATGSAAGCFGAYLLKHLDILKCEINQGIGIFLYSLFCIIINMIF